MALTPEEVAELAALARLRLTDQECAELAPELDGILAFVHQVYEVATPDVQPMTHAVPLVNVTRPDVVRRWDGLEDVLAAAPDTEDGRFRVPRILSED